MITELDKEAIKSIDELIDVNIKKLFEENEVFTKEQSDCMGYLGHLKHVLNKVVDNLSKAKKSYTWCTKEDLENHFFTAECIKCGWWGSSELCNGGNAIADTGDFSEITCPVCEYNDIDEKVDTLDINPEK